MFTHGQNTQQAVEILELNIPLPNSTYFISEKKYARVDPKTKQQQALKDWIRDAAHIFINNKALTDIVADLKKQENLENSDDYFKEANNKNLTVLKKIWDDYIFKDIPKDQREKYENLFFSYAHQGGFMQSLYTAHLEHLIPTLFDTRSSEDKINSRIDIIVHSKEIDILEVIPIMSLYRKDDPETKLFESRLIDTEIRHSIAPDETGEPQLHILTARDHIYNLKAAEDIFGNDFLKTLQKANRVNKMLGEINRYAQQFIAYGHVDKEQEGKISLAELFQHYGEEINESTTPEATPENKIIELIRKKTPECAELLAGDIKKYANKTDGKNYFINTLTLLFAIEREDLVESVVLKNLRAKAETDKNNPELQKKINEINTILSNPKIITQDNLKKIYDILVGERLLPRLSSILVDDCRKYAESYIKEGHTDKEIKAFFNKHTDDFPNSSYFFSKKRDGKLILNELCKDPRKEVFARTLCNELTATYINPPHNPQQFLRTLKLLTLLEQPTLVKEAVITLLRSSDVNIGVINKFENKKLLSISDFKKANALALKSQNNLNHRLSK